MTPLRTQTSNQVRFGRTARQLLLLIAAVSAALGSVANAQPAPDPTVAPAQRDAAEKAMTAELAEDQRQRNLKNIYQSIEQAETELRAKQRELHGIEGEGRQDELTSEIQTLVARLRNLRHDFDQIASGVDSSAFSQRADSAEISWNQEFTDLVRPLLNEMRDLTSRPREIDFLRREIGKFQDRIALTEQATAEIDELRGKVKDQALKTRLDESREVWQSRKQDLQTELAVARERLDRREGEKRSFAHSFEQLFQVFFRSRGKHLVLSLLAAIACWIVLRRLHIRLQHAQFMVSRRNSFAVRVFNLLYSAITSVSIGVTVLVVLYLYGDWVLLILVVLALLGLLWASKQALPRFWQQGALLLNMGPVREDERVVYGGLPWLVRSLNFYVSLHNPELTPATIKLPLGDLTELRSRPYAPEEPWFPTKVDDWVLLSDGTHAKVVLQSPESVRLVEPGGIRQSLSAANFAASHPRVLSAGYRITFSFGVDYKLQHQAVSDIPDALTKWITDGLSAHGYPAEEIRVTVEFEEAAASSLNLAIIADAHGKHAPQYRTLRRLLQRLCVEACDSFGWNVPFNQLAITLKNEETPLKAAAATSS